MQVGHAAQVAPAVAAVHGGINARAVVRLAKRSAGEALEATLGLNTDTQNLTLEKASLFSTCVETMDKD